MRKIVIALAVGLAACNGGPQGVPSSPAAVADSTKVDEQAALGAELLYTTASTFGNTLSRAGVIDRPRFQELDRQAYAHLLVVREAYKTGNSVNFVAGLENLNNVVTKIKELNNAR